MAFDTPWQILDQSRLNIPGLMQAAGEAKTRRLQEMMLNRQVEREDRDADREDKLLGIYAKLKQPGSQPEGGGPASGGVGGGEATPPRPSNIPSGSPMSPGQPGQMGAMGAPKAPADPVRVQSWMAANQEVVNELMMIAPDKAFALSDQLSSMDGAQLKRVQEMNQVRASVAMHLQSFGNQARRQAELQRIMPQLAQMGMTPEAVQQELGDLSDAALQAPVVLSMDVEKLLEQQNKDRTFEETQRHNRTTEGVAQGGLAVRQGALEVARTRAARAGGGDSDNSDLGYLLGGD